jgi:hypothetical protein
MPRVPLNSSATKTYGAFTSEADCRTLIGPLNGGYYHFATLDGLRSFVLRCNPENMPEFERSVRA